MSYLDSLYFDSNVPESDLIAKIRSLYTNATKIMSSSLGGVNPPESSHIDITTGKFVLDSNVSDHRIHVTITEAVVSLNSDGWGAVILPPTRDYERVDSLLLIPRSDVFLGAVLPGVSSRFVDKLPGVTAPYERRLPSLILPCGHNLTGGQYVRIVGRPSSKLRLTLVITMWGYYEYGEASSRYDDSDPRQNSTPGVLESIVMKWCEAAGSKQSRATTGPWTHLIRGSHDRKVLCAESLHRDVERSAYESLLKLIRRAKMQPSFVPFARMLENQASGLRALIESAEYMSLDISD